MCSRLKLYTLLLVQCTCISFLQVKSARKHLFSQLPIKYLLTPYDYQMIKKIDPINSNSYLRYYSPGPVGNYVLNPNVNYEKRIVQNRQTSKKALLMHQTPHRESFSYPSQYLEPPAFDSISNYVEFQNHSINDKDEQERNERASDQCSDVKMNGSKNMKKSKNHKLKCMKDYTTLKLDGSEVKEISEREPAGKNKSKNESSESLRLSNNGDRIEFQIQGHEGPKTYIFGFDTGDGKNRQFRLEERMKDGTVKGHYGYYDAKGKLRTIKYLAHPFHGYQEKHHESNNIHAKNNK